MRPFLSSLILLMILASGCTKPDDRRDASVIRIGVMLPYTGSYASDWDRALDWAVENFNGAGGIAGRKLELVKRDIAAGDLTRIAEEMAGDASIRAVIGPLVSSDVYKTAPIFINHKKILMAPVATAADLSRAFAKFDYFWRLTEPDISQTKTLLLLAQSEGAHTVGLITEDSEYGASFEDWFGYFATELGLTVSGIQVIAPNTPGTAGEAWNKLIDSHPDAIISSINQPAQNIELVKAYRQNGRQCRLLLSDAAVFQSIVNELGPLAENLEGTTITSDPTSGFDLSYHVRYGTYPGAFLSNLYDAVYLLGMALEASGGEGGESLLESLKTVVSGRGKKLSWRRDELGEALQMIRDGQFPDLQGASGALDFDELYFTDVTSTTYGHWRIDAGEFVITRFFTSDGSGRISSTSAAYRTIAGKRQIFSETGNWAELPPRSGLYAFLMAGSRGWSNYRHQADVLNTYQLLKKNGVDDDHIILILEDDIAGNPSNHSPGTVINEPGGDNLYHDVRIDYRLSDMGNEDIRSILMGVPTATAPVVLPSDSTRNILVFTSGHGTPDGMVVENREPGTLDAGFWGPLFDDMSEAKRYRQIFCVFEACYAGVIGEGIHTPGVLVMTGANPFETSKACYYDPSLKSWLADTFAWSVNYAIGHDPETSLDKLYESAYTFVNGSHVSFFNTVNFGNIFKTRLSGFVYP